MMFRSSKAYTKMTRQWGCIASKYMVLLSLQECYEIKKDSNFLAISNLSIACKITKTVYFL